jgi:hypothetical protein
VDKAVCAGNILQGREPRESGSEPDKGHNIVVGEDPFADETAPRPHGNFQGVAVKELVTQKHLKSTAAWLEAEEGI